MQTCFLSMCMPASSPNARARRPKRRRAAQAITAHVPARRPNSRRAAHVVALPCARHAIDDSAVARPTCQAAVRPAGRGPGRMVEPVRARERAGAAETRRRAESSSLDAATARSGSSRRIWQLGKPSQEAAAQQRSPCNLHASTGPRSPKDKGNGRFHTMNGPLTLLKKKCLQRCISCLHGPRGQHIKHKPKFSFVCIVGAIADKDMIKNWSSET